MSSELRPQLPEPRKRTGTCRRVVVDHATYFIRDRGLVARQRATATAIALSLRKRIELNATQRFSLVGVGLSNFGTKKNRRRLSSGNAVASETLELNRGLQTV